MKSNPYLRICALQSLIFFHTFVNLAHGTGLIDDESKSIQFLALSKEYIIYRKRLMWSEALDFCSKCVGEFATFETPKEALKVIELIYYQSSYPYGFDHGVVKQEWGMNRRYWFGLSDEKSEGQWKWFKNVEDEGTPMTNIAKYKWYPGQPDHIRGNNSEHCGCFWSPEYQNDKRKNKKKITGRRETHFLNDNPCDHMFYFICKVGKLPPSEPDNPICNSTGNVSVISAGTSHLAPKVGEHTLGDPLTPDEFTAVREKGLNVNNLFRRWHRTPELILDASLSEKAQEAAEHVVRFQIQPRNTTGMNFFTVIISDPKGRLPLKKLLTYVEKAVIEWYFEICDRGAMAKKEFNHFTQLIWKQTAKVGFGMATNRQVNRFHVVAVYDPVGNYDGEYDQEVKPIRCGVDSVCYGETEAPKKKSGHQKNDCPAPIDEEDEIVTNNASSLGRSLGVRKHKGKPIQIKDIPSKVLDKRQDNTKPSFWTDY